MYNTSMEIFFAQAAQEVQQSPWWLNPWLLTIASSIVSGLLVNYISRLIWSRRDNKELRQKIDVANSEIIYALRPSVAEGAMPSKAILEALINGTARKHSLKPENLMTINEFADSLVKEVMDSTFISHEQKIKFSNEVIKLKVAEKASSNVPSAEQAVASSRLGTSDPYYLYRVKQTQRSVLILTFATVALTIMSAMIVSFRSEAYTNLFFPNITNPYFSVILTASMIPLLLVFYYFLMQLRRRAEYRKAQDDARRRIAEIDNKLK